MDNIGWIPNSRPGFRLKKLEVTNWGTFDSTRGQVYSLNPGGRSALLVGQNGSGKSTLVDALLTLLVQPGVRNYNVAAGAKKRERDERTYIRGACGRLSGDDAGSVTEFLRPNDKHYSVILACFERESTGDLFTLAQVLQITGDGEVDKTYAFAERECSIAEDLSGLSRSDKIRKQLQQRAFKATSKYAEYLPWLAKVTSMRPKAMDVFNQTVAVKDIQSLNRFVRDHMLEAKPWRDRIDSLLSHFSQLSQAHQALVRARRQVDLLAPIEKASQNLQRLSTEVALFQGQLDAIDSFFRQQAVDWLEPRLSGNSQAISKAKNRKLALENEINALDDTQRYFKNEIEKTGGDRLRQLPHQLETQHALLASKKRERSRLTSAIKTCGLQYAIHGLSEFEALPAELAQVQSELAGASTQIAQRRLECARDLTAVRGLLDEEQTQLEFLQQQSGNLPGALAELRARIAESVGRDISELPFVCELVSVSEGEVHWQNAIEMLLRPIALTMLVPPESFSSIEQYVQEQQLLDARSVGQKLRIARVDSNTASAGNASGDATHPDSLIRKLRFRDAHGFAGWVRGELRRQLDFRCCSTLEQFQRAPGLAVMQNRHAKWGTQIHEKDDRPVAVDSKHFVLGWDNAARIEQMRTSIAELKERETKVLERVAELESDSKKISRKLAAVETALSFDDYDLIDTEQHRLEIEKLESERTAIEESNDAVRILRERLEETISRRFAAQKERDSEVAAESNLLRESEQALGILERFRDILDARQRDGTWTEHSAMFERLRQSMGSRMEKIQDVSQFAELQAEASQELQKTLGQLNSKAEPIRGDVIRSMQKFLSDSPEERDDLRADLLYLEGFLGLLAQLRQDDLPKYEKRFQERLNEKVIQEIGVFHAALQCEKQEIVTKIEVLNSSLEQLEYRAGTHMRLEPRNVSDREIREFQAFLRECLSDEFEGEATADEARFSRIENLIRRLREEERWRDKVTDVRRWFDFAARELDSITGEERSCYEDSSGQSGGEKAKLAFTILVAAIAYQFDIDPQQDDDDRFHFVVVDEMFSKVDDRYAEYALQLFEKFGLQLLIVAPLDAKARITEPYVGCYLHTVKNEKTRASEIMSMTAEDYELAQRQGDSRPSASPLAATKPK